MDALTREFPPALARAQYWANENPFLRRFTLMTRLLLAMSFLPTGLVKATGQRFTLLDIDNPVGFFFEAMYRTGPFWYFIGIMQILAAVFLLIPATSTLGALLFLPIAVSIFLITWGVGFSGTVYIASLILLAAIYLVCWDAERIWTAGSSVLRRGPRLTSDMHRVELAGWGLGGIAGMGLLLGTRGFVTGPAMSWFVGVGGLAVLLALVGLALGARRSRAWERRGDLRVNRGSHS